MVSLELSMLDFLTEILTTALANYITIIFSVLLASAIALGVSLSRKMRLGKRNLKICRLQEKVSQLDSQAQLVIIGATYVDIVTELSPGSENDWRLFLRMVGPEKQGEILFNLSQGEVRLGGSAKWFCEYVCKYSQGLFSRVTLISAENKNVDWLSGLFRSMVTKFESSMPNILSSQYCQIGGPDADMGTPFTVCLEGRLTMLTHPGILRELTWDRVRMTIESDKHAQSWDVVYLSGILKTGLCPLLVNNLNPENAERLRNSVVCLDHGQFSDAPSDHLLSIKNVLSLGHVDIYFASMNEILRLFQSRTSEKLMNYLLVPTFRYPREAFETRILKRLARSGKLPAITIVRGGKTRIATVVGETVSRVDIDVDNAKWLTVFGGKSMFNAAVLDFLIKGKDQMMNRREDDSKDDSKDDRDCKWVENAVQKAAKKMEKIVPGTKAAPKKKKGTT